MWGFVADTEADECSICADEADSRSPVGKVPIFKRR